MTRKRHAPAADAPVGAARGDRLRGLSERRLRAASQDDAHARSQAITTEMKAEGQVLIARSWVASARGGTLTMVFAPRQRTV